MKLSNLLLILCLIFQSSCFLIHKSEETKSPTTELTFPQPIGWVNDYANVFTTQERNELEKLLQEFSDKTTNQIVLVTMNELPPEANIQDYTEQLGNEWGVGIAGINNGLVMLLSMKDRKIRISTGEGTRKILSDEFIQTLVDSTIIPKFKEEKYFNGVQMGLKEIISHWNSEN